MKVPTILAALATAGAVSAQSDTSSPAPTPTPSNCPAAGETNAAGDYGCNPNRDYPDKACALIGDCYILRGLGVATSTASPTPTPSNCPAPGETSPNGDYGCNPAHEYPDQACALVGGCYVLRGLGVATSTASPTPTPSNCPAPGETSPNGDYGCNPAHAYPDKACALVGGCYVLRGLGINGTSTHGPGPHPTKSGHPVKPTSHTTVINGVTTVVPVHPTKPINGPVVVTTGADGTVTTLPPSNDNGGNNGGNTGGNTGGDDGTSTGNNAPGTVPTAGAVKLTTAAAGLAAIVIGAALL